MAENMNALMIEKLNQAYTAEKLALENLPKLAQAATSPTLKQAFEAHLQETRQQVARLEQAGQQIGAPMQGAPCEAMQGLAAEAERLIAQHQRGPLLVSCWWRPRRPSSTTRSPPTAPCARWHARPAWARSPTSWSRH